MVIEYLLVSSEPFRIGFLGAPLAVVISYWTLLLVMFIYAYFTVPRHTWAGVSRVIFQDLGIVFRYGVAGIASTCSEWWAFEFLGLGATFLGEVTQASTAIYATTLGIVWQLPFAISISVSIRIGNLLGANFPKKAKKAATTAWVFAGVVVTLNAVILLIVKDHFGKLFSEDPAVIEQVGASVSRS
jgi:MATE family multidrug resistance protein